MIKISFDNSPGYTEKYSVDTKKGIVTCVRVGFISNYYDAFRGLDREKFDKILSRYGFNGSKKYFIGKAYCNPNDKFDVEVGKRIAEGRMRLNVYDTVKSVTNDVRDTLASIIDLCYDTEEKYTEYRINESNHIKDVIEKAEI